MITGTPSFGLGTSEKLASLQVGEQKADESALESGKFTVSQSGVTEKDVKAVGKDNASVTILPVQNQTIRILTESEDHTKQGVYTITLGESKV